MSELCLGFDIGGTKCAVILGEYRQDSIQILTKDKLPTDRFVSPEIMIERMIASAEGLLNGRRPDKIGVSCGSPLDSAQGVILSPPNLPGWDRVPITEMLQKHFGIPARLHNDANACAIAEWKFGAGKGCKNMIFLTFGTGFGAGLILDGRLYQGTTGDAGEVGHVRIAEDGPLGYNKYGSMEGFCSGSGLARLGISVAHDYLERGIVPSFYEEDESKITAKTIGDAADAGDACAIEVYKICGEKLGLGLAMMMDILNPQKIVIGSIFARSRNLIWPYAEKVIRQEALPHTAAACEVVPAALTESIGDFAAIAAAFI